MIFLFTVFCASVFAESPAISDEPEVLELRAFSLSLPLEVSLFAAGGAGWAFRFYKSHADKSDEWDGTLYDKSDINAFDRWAAQPYRKTLDNLGTAGVVAAIIPSLFSVYASDDYLTAGVMFAETMLVASGTYSALKTVVKRNRPYMYYDGGSEGDMEDGDYENSWPSGHTTNAFAAAVFAGYTFSAYNPDSPWKIPVWIAALGTASATGVLRVASGNHFPSDVISGAAIGALSGFLVPYLHTLHFGSGLDVAALPGGLSIRVRY